MKRRNFLIAQFAVLVLGFSMTTACSDDDNKSEEQKEQETQEAQQKADAFWDVVGQLTSIDNYTSDYQDKTFEPTIGEPLEGNSTVRVVATNDMASAAARFASLVGVSIDGNTSSYTYTNDAVGTLTYTKTDNGQSWATVDVNIKQLPKLQQIIYRSPEQGGTNASIEGTCYYRFGDVVRKVFKDKDDNNLERVEYWVCVRPAFTPEGKGDSHWITLSLPPKKYIWTYTTKTGDTYGLPTGIGTNKEHMQNLAEMVYAISYPYRWEKNVKQNPAPGIFSSGLRMFHDFSHDENMLMYHSPWFWKRVAKAWEDKNIEELDGQNVLAAVFGDPVNKIDLLRTKIADSGLRLLAKGYSWWTSSSNKLSLYQYIYMNGEGNESNMHKEIYTEVKKDYKDLVSPINIYDKEGGFGEDHHPGIMSMEFFGDGLPHYVIRHATGKELAGFKPDVNATMCTEGNGLTDIYTYNQYYNIEASDKLPPEVINPKRGDVIGKNGLFYDSPNRARQDHTEPVAVVIYRGTEIDADDSGDYNGLAMSMTLADNSSVSWCDNTNYICIENTKGMESEWRKSLDGYFQTEKLVKDAHNHQAAKMAYNYKSVNGFNPKDFGFTDWFLPTAGQIIMCVENLGANVVLKNETGSCIYEIQDSMVQLYNGFYGRISNQGVQDMDCTFWTSTESTEENAVTANMSPDDSGGLNTIKKDSKMKVRPFFAF